MPRNRIEQVLRHEKRGEPDGEAWVNYHDQDEDNPFERAAERERESTIISAPPGKRTKGRRSAEDMMGSMPSDAAQSVYCLERIAGLEDQIVKLLRLCTPGALELVLKQRPSLAKYAPEKEDEDG